MLLVTVNSYGDKMKIMKSKHLLKGTNVYINDDLTPQQRNIRKKLWEECKRLRAEGKNVYISGDQLLEGSSNRNQIADRMVSAPESPVDGQQAGLEQSD